MTAEGGDRRPKLAALAGIGSQLEARREELGRTLADAERDLKIRKTHLQALESGSFRLPLGLVYQIGFLRAYAEYLGLDPTGLVAAYRRAVEEPEAAGMPGSGEPQDRGVTAEPLPALAQRLALAGRLRSPRRGTRRAPFWAVLVLLLVAALVASYALGIGPFSEGRGSSPPGSGGGSTPPTSGPGGSEPPGPGVTPGGPPPSGIPEFTRDKVRVLSDHPTQLRFEVEAGSLEVQLVFSEYVWVRATADGRIVAEGLREPGAKAEFQAQDSLELRLGRASRTVISVFGVEIGPAGPVDDARTVSFERKR